MLQRINEHTGNQIDLVVIQIPCFNEEATLGRALADLPREIPGVRRVEWQIVDDGSRDRTIQVACEAGVDHVVKLHSNRGLAEAWSRGVVEAIARGADVVVNTDADCQYDAAAIPDLIAAIRDGADVAVGARPISEIPHFSPVKKQLQHLGSAAMRWMSGTGVADAPSGFRAITREAALRLGVLSDYTYTLETLIHAGYLGFTVRNVPVPVNEDLRPSRLVKSIPSYVRRSLGTMVRIWLLYRAGHVMAGIAALAAVGAVALGVLAACGVGAGIYALAAGLVTAIFAPAAVIADSLALTRRAIMETRARVRSIEADVSRREGA